MELFTGIGVNGGIAMGKLLVYRHFDEDLKKRNIQDVNFELLRFDEAIQKAVKHLRGLYEKTASEVGEEEAMIFDVHQMMLEDVEFIGSVKNIIQLQKVNAEYALALTVDSISKIFSSMEDSMMKERASDMKDAAKHVQSFLGGEASEVLKVTQPAILLSEDLVPSETVQLDRKLVLGFITQKGSINSHTAILARTMDIPAIVSANMELRKDQEERLVILDGYAGRIYLDPDPEVIHEYQIKQEEEQQRKTMLQSLKGKKSITLDGRELNLYANIGNTEDVHDVLKNDAEGIGLFRSEFLFLGKDRAPSEEEQLNAYKLVAERMAGKKVIIRTLDIGADKKADYFHLEEEENPALGYRAIRICLEQTQLFKTQLRAIYRASAYGNVAIMFPMIISLEEIIKIKEILKEVKDELKVEGYSYSKIEIGIMIETPAAAIISDILAKEVDFFSIGTNDLTQYTCAIDRQNQKLNSFYNPHHPAVLRLIEMVVMNAHRNGIWVGICGELASDTTLTGAFIEMGIDELSVSPGKILKLREKVLNYKSEARLYNS